MQLFQLHILLRTNWLKTIRFNFYYFPIKKAVKFPVLVSYHTVLRSLRGGVKIEGKASPGMLLLGYQRVGFLDVRYNRTIWEVSGCVVLKGKCIRIGSGSTLSVSGECVLGDSLTMTGRSTVVCKDKIVFGNNVLISWDVLFMDTDYHSIYDENHQLINKDRPIIVGDNVWIGCRTTVLKGTSLPSNSIIAAGTIASGVMEQEGCIYTTNKTILKEGVTWEIV